jgi:hypothetical protein
MNTTEKMDASNQDKKEKTKSSDFREARQRLYKEPAPAESWDIFRNPLVLSGIVALLYFLFKGHERVSKLEEENEELQGAVQFQKWKIGQLEADKSASQPSQPGPDRDRKKSPLHTTTIWVG